MKRKEKQKRNDELKRRYREIQEVGVINSERKLILIRIPASVKRLIDSEEQKEVVIGKIRIYDQTGENNGQQAPQKVTLHLDENFVKKSNSKVFSTDYNLRFTQKPAINNSGRQNSSTTNSRNGPNTTMKIFSEGSGGVEIQGEVENICSLQPILQKNSYAKIKQNKKFLEEMKPKTKLLSFEKERELREMKRKNRNIVFGIGKKADDEKEIAEIAAMDLDRLREVLFNLFHKHEFLTTKEVKIKTRQPEKNLKNVLKKIAIFHKSGPNASKWELQSHYK